ncbi:MAG: hypothetical protein D6680_21415 [Cyanobacteria bacterium J007]|nr:MAG: hypothetical protein D6680_21415 [Cyanobacteria bacterium J007]
MTLIYHLDAIPGRSPNGRSPGDRHCLDGGEGRRTPRRSPRLTLSLQARQTGAIARSPLLRTDPLGEGDSQKSPT